MNNNADKSGFSLIELLVTVSVAGLILAAGVPSFRSLVMNNRMATGINEFVSDMTLARSEAVKRGVPVTICKRDTAGTGCSDNTDWTLGWIVFVDQNSDGDVDDGEEIKRIHGAVSGLSALVGASNRHRVTFNPSGYAPGYNATFLFCDSRGTSSAKGRVLSNMGRLREATASDLSEKECP